MTYGIPSFKLTKDLVDAEIDILRTIGVDIRCGVDVGKDVTLDDLRTQGYQAIYVAIGAQGGRLVGIPGEDGPGVYSAMDFLREALAHPDTDLAGSTVVIGGGNVAVDAARVALRCGTQATTMVCLEQPGEMAASAEEVTEATEEGVVIENGWGPVEVLRNESGAVRGVVFKRCVRVFDDSGAFAPVYDDADRREIPCDSVIVAIGQSIEWGGLLEGTKVELGRGKTALADPVTYQTAEEDVFVGGDVYTGPQFVIDAIAAGHEAAMSLHRFVQKGSSLVTGRNRRHYVELNKSDVVLKPGYDESARQNPVSLPPISLRHNWDDPTRSLTQEQIATECGRCLACGVSVVDPNKCIGCGLCTTRCGFNAMFSGAFFQNVDDGKHQT